VTKGKVKINQAAWGNEIMAGQGMRNYLQGVGQKVAGKIPGSTVEVSSSRTVRGGGRRARATITTPISLSDEAKTGQALSALQSVVPNARAPKKTKAYKQRAAKRQKRRGA